MNQTPRAQIQRQIQSVRTRLLLQSLLHQTFLGLALGLFFVATWFLAKPFVAGWLPEMHPWLAPSLLFGSGLMFAWGLAFWYRPNSQVAAFALDDRFRLQERVTTLLSLPDEILASAPGQALLDDVVGHLKNLDIRTGFPLQISWRRAAGAGSAAVLMIACYFMEPVLTNLRLPLQSQAENKILRSKEIEEQLDNLRKVTLNPKGTDPTKSEELQQLEAEWTKILNQPLDLKNEEKIRERVQELRNLEQKMRDRLEAVKEKTQKNDGLKNLLEKLGQLGDKNQRQDGPAKDFEDALTKGDFQKARESLEKIAKDMKNKNLTPEQLKDLADEFKALKHKIKKMTENDEKLKKIREAIEKGELDREQVEKELKKFEDLEELGQILGECQECIGKGDLNGALGRMKKLAGELEEMELTEEEFRRIVADLEALQDGLDGINEDLDDGEPGNGMGKGRSRRPGGRRPIDPNDPDGKVVNERQRGQADPTGQNVFAGFAKGGQFSRVPAKQVEGAFRQAVQEAPEALDRQRIPDDAADIARSYFRKLGNQR